MRGTRSATISSLRVCLKSRSSKSPDRNIRGFINKDWKKKWEKLEEVSMSIRNFSSAHVRYNSTKETGNYLLRVTVVFSPREEGKRKLGRRGGNSRTGPGQADRSVDWSTLIK